MASARFDIGLVLVLVAACGGEDRRTQRPAVAAAAPSPVRPDAGPPAPPTCADVVAHLTSIGRGATAHARSEDDVAYLEGWLARQGQRLATDCAARPWSATYRTCLADATGDADIVACDRDDHVARGADLGGASCAEVGLHFARILADEPPPPPYAPTPSTPEKIARNAEALAIVCENVPWTRAQKACMLRVTTGDELRRCQTAP